MSNIQLAKLTTPDLLDPAGEVLSSDFFLMARGETIVRAPPGTETGRVYPDSYAANTTPGTTDMTEAAQTAIDAVAAAGGGNVYFRPVKYLVSDTLLVPSNVFLVGEGWYFLNDYIDDELILRGSIIEAAPGTNADIVLFRADISELSGSSFPRIHAGMRNIAIHGRRSDDQATTAKDLNSTGRGIICSGVSYVTLDNVLAYRCAGNGIAMESHDYSDGNGSRSCNNMNWRNVVSLGNGNDGFSLFGGDSTFSQLIGGYNGRHGMTGNAGPIVASKFWNNQGRGMALSGQMTLSASEVYDNKEAGISISAAKVSIVGNEIYSNGAGNGAAATTCGILLQDGATELNISANSFTNKSSLGDHQDRGIYSASGTIGGVIGPNVFDGQVVQDINLHAYSGFSMHGETGSDVVSHPGFTLAGKVNANSNKIESVRGISGDVWGVETGLASGTLEIGNNMMVSLDISGGGTITDITTSIAGLPILFIRNLNSTSVTIEHNTAKLRLNGGVNVTLAQHQSIMFVYVSGTIWQQV